METVMLLLVLITTGIIGFIIMKKVDNFLAENSNEDSYARKNKENKLHTVCENSIAAPFISGKAEIKKRESMEKAFYLYKDSTGMGADGRKEGNKKLETIPGKADREEFEKHRGHLKIFFGYASRTGKTYAMLKAAHEAKERGIDVVAGIVETHAQPQTYELLQGLEQIDDFITEENGNLFREFNLDAAMKRKPTLILVDGLAHTNAKGCRHAKRYQDVEELLKSGIDVYTTVSVQQIESLNDLVAAITGIMVEERVPDAIFDNASQVELIDIEPQELLERLQSEDGGEEHGTNETEENSFRVENLIALREIALRRCADRINTLSEDARKKSGAEYHTEEHILVCLSPAPSNAKIIRTAARMAQAFRGIFTALYVETPDYSVMDEEDRKRLWSNIRLAKQLGAKIETVYGEDVPFQIAEFSRLSGISKIVIGRSVATKKFLFGKSALTEKLISQAPDVEVHIIPDSTSEFAYRVKRARQRTGNILNGADIVKSVGMLFLSSAVGYGFWKLGLSESNIIMMYILGVLLISVLTTHQVYSLVSAVISVFVFNFLFTEPRYTLHAYDKDYPVTFFTMFVAAFLTGSLAIRLKRQAAQAALAAFRTKILFDTNQLLERVREKEQIISVTATQLLKMLNKAMVIYFVENGTLSAPQFFASEAGQDGKEYLSESEKAVAGWVLKNNKHAGAATDTFSDAKCYYLSIRTSSQVYGVIGIVLHGQTLDAFENSILLSILGECALALENEKNAREKEEAALIAQKEQLRANLLRSISHDLRTPLTSISGNASNLLSNEEKFDLETKKQLYADIYEDSMWLINLVENLLSVTKIEDGKLNICLRAVLLDEIVTEALQHLSRKKEEHNISYKACDDFIFVKADAGMIMQVIINIVDNAVKYTQKKSEIVISTQKLGNKAIVRIADNGPGILDEKKPFVFDMFYSGAKNIADSRRSLGLGLSLCKSIITAHGGELQLSDNIPHGAVFTFSLPVEEVVLHE